MIQISKFQKTLLFCMILGLISYFGISILRNDSEIKELLYDEAYPLENIIDDEEKLLSSDSQQIFFLETHMHGRRSLRNARQACR